MKENNEQFKNINILDILKAVKRENKLVKKIIVSLTIIVFSYSLITPKTWEGEFEIVLEKKNG